MPKILEVCEEFFGTRDVYELFEITKDALPKDIKKAYYKLSLKVHPDRVAEEEKALATEKFKILSKLHQVLCDKEKKALYDEKGVIDDDDDYEGKLSNWLELWKKIFKPITTEDIDNYQKDYVGSDLERSDIKKAYVSGKGCINYMFNKVPFLQLKDEPRMKEIVKELIAAGEVPEYKTFTHESAQKRNRRHKKYARESEEADEIKKKLQAKSMSLEQELMKRNEERASNFDSMIDQLMEKYGGEDDNDFVDFSALETKRKKRKNKSPVKKEKLHRVQSGRVKKRSP